MYADELQKDSKTRDWRKVRILLGIPPLLVPATLLAALLVVYSMSIVSVSSWIRHALYLRPCARIPMDRTPIASSRLHLGCLTLNRGVGGVPAEVILVRVKEGEAA